MLVRFLSFFDATHVYFKLLQCQIMLEVYADALR